MAALSNYAEKLLLDWLMTSGAATRPTAWYVALFTAAPSDSGGGTEVSTGGYSRQALTCGAASTPAGSTTNTASLTFTAGGAAFGTVTHIGIFDAASAGNLLWHGAATSSKFVDDGDSYVFDIGDIQLYLA